MKKNEEIKTKKQEDNKLCPSDDFNEYNKNQSLYALFCHEIDQSIDQLISYNITKYNDFLKYFDIRINDNIFSPLSSLKASVKKHLFYRAITIVSLYSDQASKNTVKQIDGFTDMYLITQKNISPKIYNKKSSSYILEDEDILGKSDEEHHRKVISKIKAKDASEASLKLHKNQYEWFISSVKLDMDIYDLMSSLFAYTYKLASGDLKYLHSTMHVLPLFIYDFSYPKKLNSFIKAGTLLNNRIKNSKETLTSLVNEFIDFYINELSHFEKLKEYLHENLKEHESEFNIVNYYIDTLFATNFYKSTNNHIIEHALKNIDFKKLYKISIDRIKESDQHIKEMAQKFNDNRILLDYHYSERSIATSFYYLDFLKKLKLYNVNLNDISFSDFFVSIENPCINMEGLLSYKSIRNQMTIENIYIDFISNVLEGIPYICESLFNKTGLVASLDTSIDSLNVFINELNSSIKVSYSSSFFYASESNQSKLKDDLFNIFYKNPETLCYLYEQYIG